MSITVRKLIEELEKIENKFLEVEVSIPTVAWGKKSISKVTKEDKKILILIENDYD